LGPTIASVVSAASQFAGPVAPGELISLHGIGIGPAAIVPMTLDSSGNIATSLDSVQVLFDGKPAPLLYASPGQINAIVPYEVSGQAMTTVQVINGGIQSAACALPVTNTAPGIFTQNETGVGPAAVLNQDNSVNTPANPAPRGSTIQIFATGGGQTSPPSATGTITPSPPPTLAAKVTVTIGGMQAAIAYAGAAPEEAAGVVQVNAVVPQDVQPGPALPISLTISGVTSQGGATISVE
jgi:uncharacterized protein (TIGR03437 family)